MAMDFFEHQERARRKTGRLVLLFVVAVISIITLVYLVVALLLANSSGTRDPSIWRIDLLLGVSTGVIAVVALGSLYKISQLRGGGRVVAESLGGRLLDTGTSDPDERKLLNVVEEMAIASGVPVPPVYMMHEEGGINAFAAGFTPDDAVIGVTRGCVEILDRDELQGVIAHEFSHILNGDMRLNIRLIGVLHGILVIALIGQVVLRSVMYSSMGRRSRSSNKKEGGALPILAIGVALLVIGYVGYFFGGLIKAAVSRQREFLADASAVQFTRYPKGIGGALRKIGGHAFGSSVISPNANEVSHMFFGQGVKSWLGAASATHPPLDQRIRRIQPDWDGNFAEVSPPKRSQKIAAHTPADNAHRRARLQAAMGISAMTGEPGGPGEPGEPGEPMQAATDNNAPTAPPAIDQLGSLTEHHIAYAATLIESIPDELTDAAHSTFGACTVVYALLLDTDQDIASKQTQTLRDLYTEPIADATIKLRPAIQRMNASARLPLIDLAMPALHELSPDQYTVFKQCVTRLAAQDNKTDLFEWTLSQILIRRLAPAYEPDRRTDPRVRFYSLKPMSQHLSVLLSTLARYGHQDAQKIQAAFTAATNKLALNPPPKLADKSHCGLQQISDALQALLEVSPREKRKVLHACAACITADHQVTLAEGELLRAVADSLGCPMPPILPGQPLT